MAVGRQRKKYELDQRVFHREIPFFFGLALIRRDDLGLLHVHRGFRLLLLYHNVVALYLGCSNLISSSEVPGGDGPMDNAEFAQTRRYLEKTQAQLATLLGVSPKAVQSFEQGWRRIPLHVERQLLLLLFLKRRPLDSGEPCWDRKSCDPEVRERCIAWEVQAGDLCWFINGTRCGGRVQKSWTEKMQLCRQCEVFRSADPSTLGEPE